MKNIQEIKNDLSLLNNYEVVLFGSYASGKADIRSDIDIAIITREKDRKKAMELWNDMKYRFKENQFKSAKEKIMALERYRRSSRISTC